MDDRSRGSRRIPARSEVSGLLRLIAQISTSFITVPTEEIDQEINNALQLIAQQTGVDRAFIMQFLPDAGVFRMTHEWCAPGVERVAEEYRNVQSSELTPILAWIVEHGSLCINSIDELPKEAVPLRARLIRRGVKSILAVPLDLGGRYPGCLGFSSISQASAWSSESASKISIAAQIFVNALQRQHSERMYRDVVETANDLIWRVDRQGCWTFLNGACQSIFGYRTDEMLGRCFTEFQSPEISARDWQAFQEVLGGKPVHQYDTEFRHKDGSVVYLSFNARRLVDSLGVTIGTTGTATNITDRRLMECALNDSESRFQNYFELPIIGIAISSTDRRWLNVNDKFCEMIGYTRNELLGMHWTDLTHPDDLERDQRLFTKMMNGECEGYSVEKRFNRPDGSVLYALATTRRVVGENGSGDYILAVMQDITDQKAAEEEHDRLQLQLFHSQKMDAIGQLAAGIAHDLNNALSAVMGHLELVRFEQGLPQSVDSSVQVAFEGCDRARALIQQLLGFSRQTPHNLELVNPEDAVTDTVNFVGRLLGNDVEISIAAPEPPIGIKVDRAQFQQALTNLLLNAKQAMPGGGRIEVAIGSKSIGDSLHPETTTQSGEYVTITIKDTGCGISPENLQRIFDPFFTTKEIKNGSLGGSGLGLAMVYRTMQSHKGWVEVTSEVGNGTCFTLILPRYELLLTAANASTVLPLSPQSGKLGKVLIIDDEPALVELTQRFLERAGMEPIAFERPLEALAWYENHFAEVDLCIVDFRMPVMGGAQCFDRIRTINPEAAVIILSGYIGDDTARQLLTRGAKRFFQKPLRYSELTQWVVDYIARSKAPSSRLAGENSAPGGGVPIRHNPQLTLAKRAS